MGSAAQPRRQGQNENDEERSDGSMDSEELRRAAKRFSIPKQPELKSIYITVLSCWYTTTASRDHGAESNSTDMLEGDGDKSFDSW